MKECNWRIENLCIEGPKSRSRGSKSEVWRVHNRGLGGFLAALGAAGRSWDHPEGVVVRLGGVLEPSWGRLGASWGRLGAEKGQEHQRRQEAGGNRDGRWEGNIGVA